MTCDIDHPSYCRPVSQVVARLRPLPSPAVASVPVPDDFLITCPFCGEQVDIYIEADVTGAFIQDCEVCCNPWRVDVWWEDGKRYVNVTRGDGSE